MKKRQTKKVRQNRKKRWQWLGILVVVLLGIVFGKKLLNRSRLTLVPSSMDRPPLTVDLLTPNPYSRPQTELKQVKGIVVHYTANPKSTAKQNRDYFEGLKDSHVTSVSSHFVIGIDGEIIQCIPTKEIAYASNERNKDTISIECCHIGQDGKFTKETYTSLVSLTSWLCVRYQLNAKDVIRHYDITGKNCPKYFVENESAWKHFRQDVDWAIDRRRSRRS